MRVAGFEIVFQKLAEAREGTDLAPDGNVCIPQAEFDEIDELRRLALELSQPPQQTYTRS